MRAALVASASLAATALAIPSGVRPTAPLIDLDVDANVDILSAVPRSDLPLVDANVEAVPHGEGTLIDADVDADVDVLSAVRRTDSTLIDILSAVPRSDVPLVDADVDVDMDILSVVVARGGARLIDADVDADIDILSSVPRSDAPAIDADVDAGVDVLTSRNKAGLIDLDIDLDLGIGGSHSSTPSTPSTPLMSHWWPTSWRDSIEAVTAFGYNAGTSAISCERTNAFGLLSVSKYPENGGEDRTALFTFQYPTWSVGKQCRIVFGLNDFTLVEGTGQLDLYSSNAPAPRCTTTWGPGNQRGKHLGRLQAQRNAPAEYIATSGDLATQGPWHY